MDTRPEALYGREALNMQRARYLTLLERFTAAFDKDRCMVLRIRLVGATKV